MDDSKKIICGITDDNLERKVRNAAKNTNKNALSLIEKSFRRSVF